MFLAAEAGTKEHLPLVVETEAYQAIAD